MIYDIEHFLVTFFFNKIFKLNIQISYHNEDTKCNLIIKIEWN